MPRKKSSTKKNNREVAKIREKALQMKRDSVTTAQTEKRKMTAALNIVERIIEAEPGKTTKGRFPELWAETAEALNHELETQRAVSEDIVRIARKTTELLQVSKNTAVENLLGLIDQMESRGDIEVPEA